MTEYITDKYVVEELQKYLAKNSLYIDDKCMLTGTNTKPTLRNVKQILENRYCNSKTDVL